MLPNIGPIVKPTFISSLRQYHPKNALQDSFGRFHNYLRISLTEKCNLRCVYCMPMEGVPLTPKADHLSLEERKRSIRIFTQLGVTKIRFTGGEPTISNQLKELIGYSKAQSNIQSIGITTNAIILHKQLDDLIESGLTSVNISLDSLIPESFEQITRRDKKNLYRVLSSIYESISKGLHVKVKLKCFESYKHLLLRHRATVWLFEE